MVIVSPPLPKHLNQSDFKSFQTLPFISFVSQMGFLFSLRGKVSKGPKKPEATKIKAFEVEEKPEFTKKEIDSFDAKKGAMQGDASLDHKPKLVIKPVHQSTKLRRRVSTTDESQEGQNPKAMNKAASAYLSGETLNFVGSLVIPVEQESDSEEVGAENTEKDYEDVPVEEFGAALLRGMGWKGEDKETLTLSSKYRQRGAVLGIGAKPIGKELETELLDRKNLTVPLVRREEKQPN